MFECVLSSSCSSLCSHDLWPHVRCWHSVSHVSKMLRAQKHSTLPVISGAISVLTRDACYSWTWKNSQMCMSPTKCCRMKNRDWPDTDVALTHKFSWRRSEALNSRPRMIFGKWTGCSLASMHFCSCIWSSDDLRLVFFFFSQLLSSSGPKIRKFSCFWLH